jgi:hypothetical protein
VDKGIITDLYVLRETTITVHVRPFRPQHCSGAFGNRHEEYMTDTSWAFSARGQLAACSVSSSIGDEHGWRQAMSGPSTGTEHGEDCDVLLAGSPRPTLGRLDSIIILHIMPYNSLIVPDPFMGGDILEPISPFLVSWRDLAADSQSTTPDRAVGLDTPSVAPVLQHPSLLAASTPPSGSAPASLRPP